MGIILRIWYQPGHSSDPYIRRSKFIFSIFDILARNSYDFSESNKNSVTSIVKKLRLSDALNLFKVCKFVNYAKYL